MTTNESSVNFVIGKPPRPSLERPNTVLLEKNIKEKRALLQLQKSASLPEFESFYEDVENDGSSDSSHDNHSNSQPLSIEVKKDWEIVEGLKEGQKYDKEPEKYDGFLMKRRKWPMKGWHKRYFILEKGTLTYAKTPADIQRRKIHGSVDVGLSVMSIKKGRRRIDLDTEDSIYHLKAKTTDSFQKWVTKLRGHRLYRQHHIAFGSKDVSHLVNIASPTVEYYSTPLSAEARRRSLRRDISRSRSSTLQSQTSLGYDRVTAWLSDSVKLDQCNKELTVLQGSLFHLTSLLQELQQLPTLDELDVPPSPSSSKKTRRLSFGKGKFKKKPVEGTSNKLSVANAEHQLIRLSSSNPNLQVMNSDDSSKNGSSESSHKLFKSTYDKREHENKVREEFITASTEVHKNMRSLLQTIVSERSRLKQALEQDIQPTSHNVEIYQLQTQLQRAYAQNTDLKERLGRIFREADLTATPMHPIATQESTPSPALVRDVSNDSKLSVSDISEFFDAEEYFILSSSSSEAAPSDEDIDSSFLSDEEFSEETGDLQSMCPSSVVENDIQPSYSKTGRRSKLPVPKADVGDFSMWNLLKKNIGKDLSKVSMPVTLNEPIGVLQRLCEELEYSELLDKASQTDDIYRRMVLVAAFAVSGYASSQHRAGQKPFNPMLGETYECIRDDKGFKFVSEQVSHHPPISACHCESDSFTFWQDIRIKTKFWGKSMEFLPIGTVNVIIPRYNDHYRWNKVTTCVHNILSGQRWVDQFGEMIIHNGPITCKLTFAKASYWSSKRYEVYGGVYNADGKVVHQLFGKWTEGMYCGISGSAKCIWRPGAMPEDYDLYYGFSRFAVELNDLDPNQKLVLPPTDSRFRPDQRMLEEGNIDDAEKEKLRIENSQRERKKQRDEKKLSYEPLFFKKSLDGDKECWVTNGHYWKLRENPGFAKMKEKFVKLW